MAMEFALSEDQVMLQTSARDFITKESPRAHVRKMSEDLVGYSPEMWNKMADLGWLGLTIPEQFGGAGMSFRDLAVIIEEMGKSLLPTPFLYNAVFGAELIKDHGTEKQKKEWLPRIAKGEVIITPAIIEEDGDFWAGGINMRAFRRGSSDFTLLGTKPFVTDAKAANYFLVAARTQLSDNPEDGITIMLVDANEWGIYVKPLETMDVLRKQFDVQFTRVPVPGANVIGSVNGGWSILEDIAIKARALLCIEMVGGMEWVLNTTVEYAKTRIAFGEPIGKLQIIKHKCADMKSALEYSRGIAEWAVEMIKDNDPDAPLAVSMAKAYCGDNYRFMTNQSVQVHGGIGFTWDHDLHFYFKRARSSDTAFGDANFHREVIAKHLDKQMGGNVSRLGGMG
jgi:alkylation response protein AidB-like acyl-CoA dehydrogenase